MRKIGSELLEGHVYEYLFTVAAFVVPFALGHSQITTGIFVNAMLIISAFRFWKKEQLAWIVLPSLAALSRGLVFGPVTPYLYYFLPLIWFSNWCLVSILSFKTENNQEFSFARRGLAKLVFQVVRFVVAAGVKVFILYGVAHIFISLRIIPSIFLTSMGIMQVMTLIGGGICAYFILHVWTHTQKK